MLNISFAWTTAALVSLNKTCTRRSWSADYAGRFKAGQVVMALDRSFRFGGRPIAKIQLTAAPQVQPTSQMTEQDYIDEGLNWMSAAGISIRGKTPRQFFDDWKRDNDTVYVVRFKVLEIL